MMGQITYLASLPRRVIVLQGWQGLCGKDEGGGRAGRKKKVGKENGDRRREGMSK